MVVEGVWDNFLSCKSLIFLYSASELRSKIFVYIKKELHRFNNEKALNINSSYAQGNVKTFEVEWGGGVWMYNWLL